MLFLLLEIRIFNHIKNQQRTGVGSTNYDTSTIKLDLHNFAILIKEQYHLLWNPDRALHFTIAPSYHRLVGRWRDDDDAMERWRDDDGAMTITRWRNSDGAMLYHVIAIASSCHRYRTIAIALSRHRNRTIASSSSRHRTIDLQVDSAMARSR